MPHHQGEAEAEIQGAGTSSLSVVWSVARLFSPLRYVSVVSSKNGAERFGSGRGQGKLVEEHL